MSWKDEEIDGLFKQAKTPEAPAFEEAFWTEMEAMLPPQQKRRKAGFWWISAATVAILAIGGAALWQTQGQTTSIQTTGTTASKPVAEQRSEADQQSANETVPTESNNAAQNTQHSNGAANPGHHTVQPNGTRPADNIALIDLPNEHETQPDEILPSVEQTTTDEELTAVNRLPVNRFQPVSMLAEHLFEIPPLEEHWYIQASAGLGQSAITGVAGRSDLIHCYTFGAGFYGPATGRMYLNLGVQGRVDFVQNLSGTVTNPDNTKTDTRYQQLYAIETPLAVGLKYGRNSFAMLVTPGFQLGYTGTYRQYDINNTEIRSERTSGKIASGRTLTMEIGLGYMRKLRPNWYVGANLNTDILRPFGDQTFAGSQRTLPLNGCILLRRTF